MSLLIKPDGATEEVFPKNGKNYSLRELQGHVEGYIEILQVGEGMIMVINEEGKLKSLPMNRDATKLVRGKLHDFDPGIVGKALLCLDEEVE